MEANVEDIELIYGADCPNTKGARKAILTALSRLRMPLRWVEWDSAAEDVPHYAKYYGSPTILIGGTDVAGAQPGQTANSCRLYGLNGKSGAPSADDVITVLSRTARGNSGITDRPEGVRGIIGSVVAVVLAVVPKLTCAACVPAYAAVLGSLGIGFWNYTPYLFPLMVLSLCLVLFMLAFQARKHRGYRPFLAGLALSAVIIVGKFYWNSSLLLYSGTIGLLLVSVWNAWPKTGRDAAPICPNCE